MRLATVDIGTNSVLLLIADVREGTARTVEERCRITRLGGGVDRSGRLDAEAVRRTLAVVREYAEVMSRLGVERRAAIGTAVLRDAEESAAFRAAAGTALGCPLEIVSGEREASLALEGLRGSFGELAEGSLLFDVGGGSTELVRLGDPRASVSLQIGAVRLTERHLRDDPPPAEQLEAVRAAIAGALAALPPGFSGAVPELFGLGGTVTTLASVELGLSSYDTERVNGLRLGRDQLGGQIERLARLPLAERRRIPGLEPARADIIVSGALIVEGILTRFGATGLRVCDRGVRWGRLWELARAG